MDDGRRNLLISAAFGAVVVVAIVILLGAIGIGWYTDNYGEVARVNGTTIDRTDFRERYLVDGFRLDYALRRMRDDLQAGRIDQADHDAAAAQLQQARQDSSLRQSTLNGLINEALEAQLASEKGITVSDADVDARITEDATRPEQRNAHLIAVDPRVIAATDDPTDADRADARGRLEKALADVAAGKTWAEVAKTQSTDRSALQDGDLGFIAADDETIDAAFRDAIFKAQVDAPTGVIEGADGVFRAGLVTSVAAAFRDPDFEQQIVEAGITMEAYRAAARAALLRERLEDKVVADVLGQPSTQRRAAEIFIEEAPEKVRVRHILFSPNDDPQAALDLPAEDPAWKTAEDDARALHEKLRKTVGTTDDRIRAFTDSAKQSDEEGAEESGGLLPFVAADELDADFATAVFADGLEHGQLLEPVRSAYGWHVVQFDDRQPAAAERAADALERARRPGADFASVAGAVSEGPEAGDGGALGWIARGQLASDVEQALFEAPIGQVSDVVTIPGAGFYIFRVHEQAERVPDADQAAELRTTAFSNWFATRMSEADVSISSAEQSIIGL
jgi:parvulin-like peptidyl-prolyl isomerase